MVWRRGNKGGYVYAISNGRRIKIGRTTRTPQKRIRDLQTGSDVDLKVLTAWKSHDQELLESRMHAVLAGKRYKREWFDITLPEAHEAYQEATGNFARYWKARMVSGVMMKTRVVRRFLFRACAVIGVMVVSLGVGWLGVFLLLNII